MFQSIKSFILGLFCKHEETMLRNEYYNECHGMHLCEYDEICVKCRQSRKFAYGNYTEWRKD